MNTPISPVWADAVLLTHAACIVFVVGGLVAIVAGNLRRRPWANRRGWRWAHLATLGFVVATTWLGIECPLTTLENRLRVAAGQSPYENSFIGHWVGAFVYPELPPAVFAPVYTLFLAAVVAAWWRWPPRRTPSDQ